MVKIKFDPSKYSEENLQRINKFIKLIKNQVELEGINRLLLTITIPLKTLKKSGFSYEESLTMTTALNKISGDETIKIINKEYYHCLEKYLKENNEDLNFFEIEEIENKKKAQEDWLNSEGRLYGVSKDNLKSALVLQYSGATGLDLLWQIEQVIREELKKNSKTKDSERIESEKTKSKNGDIKIKTKFGFLFINNKNGVVKLNNIESELNPTSEEFKVLLKISTLENHIATYEDLLGKNSSKTMKRNLTFVIRNIKKTLGILPKKKAKNKDCIKNIKGHGYRLIT